MAKFLSLVLFSVLVASLRIFNATPITDFKRELNLVGDLKQDLADSKGCEDERADCFIIANMTGGGEKLQTYCNKWKDNPAVKLCKRTCSFCSKFPSPTVEPETVKPETMKPSEKPKPIQPSVETFSGCEDERADCFIIVKMTGGGEKLQTYCNKWRDNPAVKLCKRTCSFCGFGSKFPSPTVEPETVKPETMKPSEKPKPTQPSVETFSGFQKTCLEAHNAFRAFHGVLPLKWSSKLSRDAQKWADHLASIGGIHHDPKARGKDQGENLYYEIPADRPKRLCDYDENQADCLSCKDIVQLWYNEEENYDYKTGKAKKSGAVVLHFTQLIWKASRELGMATAVSAKKGNMLVAVARYSPVGNWLGEFQENVPPPSLP